MKVNARQFRANLSRLLDENIVEITRHGEIVGVYTKIGKAKKIVEPAKMPDPELKQEIPSSPEFINNAKIMVEKKKVYTKPVAKKVEKYVGEGTYGCGCKKEGSVLCKKHHRA